MTPAHGQRPSATWLHILAVTLLLFAQWVTVVHASEHVFHEHTEACDVFQHAQNQLGNAQASIESIVLECVQAIFDCPALIDSPLSTEADPYHQRAPPSLLI
jgi:hypothetical protein